MARRGDGRYSRIWSLKQIGRVTLANELSHHLHIPFQAACEILIATEAVQDYRFGISNESDEPARPSQFILYDRAVVAHQFLDEQEVGIGTLETRDDGRTVFQAKAVNLADLPAWSSRTVFDSMTARERYFQTIEKIKS